MVIRTDPFTTWLDQAQINPPLVVQLDRFGGQEALIPIVDEFNAAEHRLPWLENRRVVMSLTPPTQPRAGP